MHIKNSQTGQEWEDQSFGDSTLVILTCALLHSAHVHSETLHDFAWVFLEQTFACKKLQNW